MTNSTTTNAATLNENLLIHAFNGISFEPEKRAASVKREFSYLLAEYAEAVEDLPDSALLESAFQEGLARRFNAWLAAKSRCISWAITGPARFPVARAEKANASERARREELDLWVKKMMARASRKNDQANGTGPIMRGDADAPARLRAKIEHLEALHAARVSYNRAARKNAAQEWLEKNAPALSEAVREDFQKELASYLNYSMGVSIYGKVFPPYCLSNESAEIKRLKGRLVEIERTRETYADGQKDTETDGGVRIERDGQANRLRLFFPDKPEADQRARLKAAGFRWAPSIGAWQAYLNRRAESFIQNEFA